MKVFEMRPFVRGAYSTDSWKYKVDNMPDDQIQALYIQLKKRGKIRR